MVKLAKAHPNYVFPIALVAADQVAFSYQQIQLSDVVMSMVTSSYSQYPSGSVRTINEIVKPLAVKLQYLCCYSYTIQIPFTR